MAPHTNSSTSSVSSGRAERSTRSSNKLPSPQRSNPRSRSLDDSEEQNKLPPRRTRSGQEEVKDNITQALEDDGEEEADEEEVTRCICQQTEYPGLPSPISDSLKRAARQRGSHAASHELVPEDLGGMFIQCDVCKVWQHGGCVGILDDAAVPEEYFCEQCRKDLHKLAISPGG